MLLAQLHDHSLDIGVAIGPLWLRVGWLATLVTVAGYALLKPFVGPESGRAVVTVTSLAGAAVLLQLLLADGLAVPQQLAVALIAASAAAVLLAYRTGAGLFVPRWSAAVPPVVLAVTAVTATVALGRAWLAGGDQRALYTGILFALVALSWYAVDSGRWLDRRPVSVAVWLLATATVASGASVAMLTLV